MSFSLKSCSSTYRDQQETNPGLGGCEQHALAVPRCRKLARGLQPSRHQQLRAPLLRLQIRQVLQLVPFRLFCHAHRLAQNSCPHVGFGPNSLDGCLRLKCSLDVALLTICHRFIAPLGNYVLFALKLRSILLSKMLPAI